MTISLQDGHTPLMCASKYGHVECMKELLDRGAQTSLQDKVSSKPDQCMYFVEQFLISQ